jgi:DNA-binding TFAR19-related protein (PDSD5 family)
MSNNMNAVRNSETAKSIVATNYNPLVDKLTSAEVKVRTPENYYNQIKNNFYLGVKAHFLIARDLYDASVNLKKPDYQRLVDMCNFSGSTQRKYLAIGGDVRLLSLFWKGKLPMKWTNQYLLTQLTEEQFKKVESEIDAETSASKIKELAKMKKEQVEKIENMLLSFLTIEVDKSKVNPDKFKSILTKIKKDLSKYPEIEIVDDKVDKVEVSISKYFEKQIKAQSKETKDNEVKQKKVA